VFGGQLLGQFIRIASLICPGKAVKSQHSVFAHEGRADEPIRYEAVRHHEGRSFATVAITARQRRGIVATSSICMHAAEDGPEHQSVEQVPRPRLSRSRSTCSRGKAAQQSTSTTPPTPRTCPSSEPHYCDSRAEIRKLIVPQPYWQTTNSQRVRGGESRDFVLVCWT
jgi:acyl-CoA thioesterase